MIYVIYQQGGIQVFIKARFLNCVHFIQWPNLEKNSKFHLPNTLIFTRFPLSFAEFCWDWAFLDLSFSDHVLSRLLAHFLDLANNSMGSPPLSPPSSWHFQFLVVVVVWNFLACLMCTWGGGGGCRPLSMNNNDKACVKDDTLMSMGYLLPLKVPGSIPTGGGEIF